MNKIELKVSSHNLGDAIKAMQDRAMAGDVFTVIVQDLDHRRSLSANAALWSWTPKIAEHTGEDIKTVFNRIKRDHGLPMVLDSHPAIGYILDKTNYYKMNDSQQLKMIEAINVTSIMSSKQHTQLRDSVQQFWEDQGLTLEYKS